MTEMDVRDPNGKWFRLDSPYPYHDSISGTLFQPGVLTKATPTASTKSNLRLVEVDDPVVVAAKPKEASPPKAKKSED